MCYILYYKLYVLDQSKTEWYIHTQWSSVLLHKIHRCHNMPAMVGWGGGGAVTNHEVIFEHFKVYGGML